MIIMITQNSSIQIMKLLKVPNCLILIWKMLEVLNDLITILKNKYLKLKKLGSFMLILSLVLILKLQIQDNFNFIMEIKVQDNIILISKSRHQDHFILIQMQDSLIHTEREGSAHRQISRKAHLTWHICKYSKTYVKQTLSKRTQIGFQDQL